MAKVRIRFGPRHLFLKVVLRFKRTFAGIAFLGGATFKIPTRKSTFHEICKSFIEAQKVLTPVPFRTLHEKVENVWPEAIPGLSNRRIWRKSI